MKMESDCERTMSPTFDMKESNVSSDATALSNFEESSRRLKMKIEPDSNLPCQTYTKSGKLWYSESTRAASHNSTGNFYNGETTQAPSTSLAGPMTSTTMQKTPSMFQPYTTNANTEATTTAQKTADQIRSPVSPLSNSRLLQNSSRSGWRVRQSEVQNIIKQRTREWKEKQALYQLMRNAGATNSLLYQRRGRDLLLARRGKYTSGDLAPKSAFHWYPGLATPNRGYPYNINSYSVMADFDPKPSRNSDLAEKRRHSSEVSSSDGEKSGSGKVDHELTIKNVVSLADKRTVDDLGRHSSKRARKSIDESSVERRESMDSGNSEGDGDLSSGKYISDFAQVFQNTPEEHQVAHINGLLSLPSTRETRYGITYGELKRRCGGPEYLSRVDLVAYVRHSKSSGRSLLDKYKIVSANHASRPTIMSKMCENEARVLGDGILQMNMDYFPHKMLAEAATEELKKSLRKNQKNDVQEEKESKMREKMEKISTTRSMLKEAFDLLHAEKDHEEMQRFELASHTFGTANLKNHLTVFDRFFQEYQISLMASISSDYVDQ